MEVVSEDSLWIGIVIGVDCTMDWISTAPDRCECTRAGATVQDDCAGRTIRDETEPWTGAVAGRGTPAADGQRLWKGPWPWLSSQASATQKGEGACRTAPTGEGKESAATVPNDGAEPWTGACAGTRRASDEGRGAPSVVPGGRESAAAPPGHSGHGREARPVRTCARGAALRDSPCSGG